MTLVAPAIPVIASTVIEDFLARQSTGQIVLHVKEGRIMQVEANAITKIDR